jgi:hypothetical protein
MAVSAWPVSGAQLVRKNHRDPAQWVLAALELLNLLSDTRSANDGGRHRNDDPYQEHAMPVTDQQAADGRGYSALLTAAFYTAAGSRFTRDSTIDEVTGFVADVRARSEGVLSPDLAARDPS